MKVESPTTVITSSEDRATYDNSNPQQGSGTMVASGLSNNEKPSLKYSFDIQQTGPKSGPRSNTMKTPPNKKDSRKLFVGGLPPDVTEEEFRIFFEQFGEIVDSVVMFDRETNRSRGFGFVTYQDPEVSNYLLSKNEVGDDFGNKQTTDSRNGGVRIGRLVMRGKTCEVKAAEPKEMTKPNRRAHQPQGAGMGNRGLASSVDRHLMMNKMYNPAEGHPVAPTHHGAYDPNMHNFVPSHYPMGAMAMGYYHPHQMAMYEGYMQQMYGSTQPMQPPQVDGSYPGIVASHMDGSSPAMYVEGQDVIHAHPYFHPQMIPPQAHYAHPNHRNAPHGSSNTSNKASVMQPATPGVPFKKEGTESTV